MDLSEYKAIYLEEFEEQLQIFEEEIMRLDQGGESEAGIQSLFRVAHTIKGSSAAMGFEKVKELTHEMENVLDQVRNHQFQMSTQLVNILFKCLDKMAMLKAEIVEQGNEISDISNLIQELQFISDDESTLENKNPVMMDTLSPSTEKWGKVEQPFDGGTLFWVDVTLSPQCEMKFARANLIENKLGDWGEVLETTPPLDDEQNEEQFQQVRWLIKTSVDPMELKLFVGNLMDVENVLVQACGSEIHIKKSPLVEDNVVITEESSSKVKAQTIRVNVERLEHLMNLVGELVIDQTRIQQVDKILNQTFGTNDAVQELSGVSNHLSRIIGELQESVMKTRMLPIEQLFNRFPRMVRDLTQTLHKEVDFIIEGKDTELDRTLIDALGDPLIHLIRNAIDHGIESTEIRRLSGKSTKGRLKISANHEDNQVVIRVEDDGAGIDPEKIKSIAIQKGIITSAEAERLNDKDIIHLIFEAGFSTATTISEISGRGVGMDIVRTDIERLNGLIDIDTELGKGTTFKIKLPLTLAIITGLKVGLRGQIFILPMNNVAEIVRVKPGEIETVRSIPVITIRNQVIPVVYLHDLFRYDRQSQVKKYLPVVVVGRAEKRIALVVDGLFGNQDIVIKNLGSHIGRVEGISGATILGDGSVALILEVAGILKMVGKNKKNN